MGKVYLQKSDRIPVLAECTPSGGSSVVGVERADIQRLMMSPSRLLTVLVAFLCLGLAQPQAYASGAFKVTGMTVANASNCTAADGKIVISLDPALAGTSPYAVSLDNGATWTYTAVVRDASNKLTVGGVVWGGYAVAIRDATAAVVYPGSVNVKGCVYEACSPSNANFVAATVPNATSYTWSTSLGGVKAGQGTRIATLELAGVPQGSTGEVCVTPSGPGCTAGPTCFGIRVVCTEVCDNGIDDDGDGLIDSDDLDCGACPTFTAFATDPRWIALGNQSDGSDFGWKPSNFTAGVPGGEVGGVFHRASTRGGKRPYYATQFARTYTDANSFNFAGELLYRSPSNAEVLLGFLKVGEKRNREWLAIHFNDQGTGSYRATLSYADDDINTGNVKDLPSGQAGYTRGPETVAKSDVATTFSVAYDATTRRITGFIGGTSLGVLTVPKNQRFAVDGFGVSMPENLASVGFQTGMLYFDALCARVDGRALNEEICGNGIDDDGDGLTDGADPDCYQACTIVTNTKDAGYGSLRQAIICANNKFGLDTIKFNIPKSDPGFDASRGVFRIEAVSTYPTITDSLLVDGLTQTKFTGNTNAVLLGAGASVGVDQLMVSKLDGPEVEIYGRPNVEYGFIVGSSRVHFRNLAVYGFYATTIELNGHLRPGGLKRITIESNVLGSQAHTLARPPHVSQPYSQELMSIRVRKTSDLLVRNNMFANNGGHGLQFRDGACENASITNNEFLGNAHQILNRDGLELSYWGLRNVLIRGNHFHDNAGTGIDIFAVSSSEVRIDNNTFERNGFGSSTESTPEDAGIRATQSSNITLHRNIIEHNYGAGVLVADQSRAITITENVIRANGSAPNRRGDARSGQYGIDLHSSDSYAGTGLAPYVTVNRAPAPGNRANGNLNFPVFTKAIFEDGKLKLEGYAPKGALIEIFEATQEEDNKLNQTYFGEGGKHLLSLTEGGTASQEKHPFNQQTVVDPFSDLNGGLGSYSSDAGAETNASAFRFEIPATAVPQLKVGMRLTSTAIATTSTVAAIAGNVGNTSEFSGNIILYESEICNDGIDNDGDGLVDCADPDCGKPVADAGPDQSVCPNTDVTLVAKASAGTPPYAYAWSDGLGATATVTFKVTATKTYTLTVTDVNGCTSTDEVKVTPADATPPTLDAFAPAVTVECHELATLAPVTATDDCGTAAVTFVDGVGPKTCPNAYTITRTYTAEDANGNTRTATRTITVQDTQGPTFDNAPENIVAECGTPVAKPGVTASDQCGPNPIVNFAEAPCSGDVSPAYHYGSAKITYLPSLNTAMTPAYPSTVEALVLTAMCTPDPAKQHRWRVRNPNTFPVLMTARDYTLKVQGRYLVPAQTDLYFFTEPIAGVLRAYWTDQAGAEQQAPKAPNSSVCTLPTAESCPCGIVRTWTATDACGNTAQTRQTVYFVDRTKPTLGNLPGSALTVSCENVPLPAEVTVTDGCSPETSLNFAESRIPGACANAYTLLRTWSAADGCGNSASFVQTITVTDVVKPTFSSVPPTATVECGNPVPTALPVASDNCTVDVQLIETQGPGVANCARASVIRLFTATDECGNTATATQRVNFVDTKAPALAGVPANVSIACGAAEPTALPTATDACDPAPKVTVVRTEVAGACAGSKTVTRVFTATDACGNTATASQVVTIEDKTKPILAGVPANVTIACGAAEPTALPTATDGCDPAPKVTVVRTEVAGACAGSKTVTRVFTATDACGSTATASQVVTIEDKTKPVLAGVPANVTIACGAAEPTALPTASDVCDSAPEVTVARTEAPGACAGSRTVTRVFTATDACGNTASASQVVTIEDKVKPVLASVPANVAIGCGTAEPTALPTASDACDPAPKVTVVRTEVAGACAGSKTVTRVFTATDACGNTATASQVVTIEDKVKPVLAAVPANITIACGAAEPTALPIASDVCDPAPTVTVVRTQVAGACAGSKTVTRVFTATDACGNTATASQVVTIEDKVKPVLASVPANVTIACGTAEPTALPTASDACDPAPKITVVRTEVAGACAGSKTVTRVFTATDACGNTATASQVVTIEDKTEPVLAGVPAVSPSRVAPPSRRRSRRRATSVIPPRRSPSSARRWPARARALKRSPGSLPRPTPAATRLRPLRSSRSATVRRQCSRASRQRLR